MVQGTYHAQPGLKRYRCKAKGCQRTFNDLAILDVHFVNSLPLLEVSKGLKLFIFKVFELEQDL
jgi:hypothetical protein